ncbi:MAG: PLP-dependent aminotransferase family protein [Alphaproteobacteria bacterium]|nr:PLP-dependent aminotransferase family protein [Alphaproteobacteria bacterium]
MSALSDLETWEPRYASRAARMQASEIRDLLSIVEKPGVISFAGGIPDPALFPLDDIRAAYQAVLASDDRANRAMQYSASEGDPDLRDWIVGYMAGKGVDCTRENILITNGSQQGLEFLGKLFLSPYDTALVGAPTYLGALQAFSAYEPVYDELRLDDTNRTALSYQDAASEAGGALKFSYVVSDFSNPTGETLSLAARTHLLRLAGELDIPIIEDNPYSDLRYDGEPVPTIQSLNLQACGSINGSRVIYCGSFSKVFTPGLRVGWICASEKIISRLILIKQASDLNSSAINQAVALHLAERCYDQQISKGRASYRLKRDAMLKALSAHMPKGASWTKPEGGLFVWLTLPEGFDGADLLQKSIAGFGVAFVPGRAFYADGGGKNTLRLSFSLPDIENIETGIRRLGALIGEVATPTP